MTTQLPTLNFLVFAGVPSWIRALTKSKYLLAVLIATAVLTGCRHQKNNFPEVDYFSDKLLIGVSQNGLYQISLAALQDAGLEIDTLSENNLYLSQGGMAVPYLSKTTPSFFMVRQQTAVILPSDPICWKQAGPEA